MGQIQENSWKIRCHSLAYFMEELITLTKNNLYLYPLYLDIKNEYAPPERISPHCVFRKNALNFCMQWGKLRLKLMFAPTWSLKQYFELWIKSFLSSIFNISNHFYQNSSFYWYFNEKIMTNAYSEKILVIIWIIIKTSKIIDTFCKWKNKIRINNVWRPEVWTAILKK